MSYLINPKGTEVLATTGDFLPSGYQVLISTKRQLVNQEYELINPILAISSSNSNCKYYQAPMALPLNEDNPHNLACYYYDF